MPCPAILGPEIWADAREGGALTWKPHSRTSQWGVSVLLRWRWGPENRAVGASPQCPPLSAPRVSRCVLWALARHHPGHDFWASRVLRNRLLHPGLGPCSVPAQPALWADRALLAARAGLLQARTALDSGFPRGLSICSSKCPDFACLPVIRPVASLGVLQRPSGTGRMWQEAFVKLQFPLSG